MKGSPGRPVQHFSEEYLARCREMSPSEIAEFLENFRLLHGGERRPSRLISLKVPPALLETFKEKCRLAGVRYQTQIKKLMCDWLAPVSGPRREGRARAPRSGRSGRP
jgi:hypothetical protein